MAEGAYESFIDLYKLLGVEPGALPTEIRAAFMKLAKHQHPDAGGSLEHMQQLNKAYATLKDPVARRAYDRMHSFRTGIATVEYRDDLGGEGAASDMTDTEMDDFIDTIFAEYSAQPPKRSIHKKAAHVIRFRKKQR